MSLLSSFLIYLEVFGGKLRRKFGAQNLTLVLLKCLQTDLKLVGPVFPFFFTVQLWLGIYSEQSYPTMQSATAALKVNTSREADWAIVSWCLFVIWSTTTSSISANNCYIVNPFSHFLMDIGTALTLGEVECLC